MNSILWVVILHLVYHITSTQACGGTFTGSSGQITSPNYPSNYNNDQTCTYNIQPTTSSLIRLVFEDFEVEGGYDWVNVFNSSDYRVARLTGSRSGTVVESATSYRVVLDPDPWTPKRGFKATWDAAPSTGVNPDIDFHTKCEINSGLTLVNTTGTKAKIFERVLLSKASDCTDTCLLLSACTYCKYGEGDVCLLYEYDSAASLNLVNTFEKS